MLGAYLILYPHARVTTIIPIFFFITIRELPAVLILGLWFVLQLFSGVGSLGVPDAQDTGGVAYFAHIGGFVAGLVLIGALGGSNNRGGANRRSRGGRNSAERRGRAFRPLAPGILPGACGSTLLWR